MKPVFFRSKRYTGKAYLSFHPLVFSHSCVSEPAPAYNTIRISTVFEVTYVVHYKFVRGAMPASPVTGKHILFVIVIIIIQQTLVEG